MNADLEHDDGRRGEVEDDADDGEDHNGVLVDVQRWVPSKTCQLLEILTVSVMSVHLKA